MQKSLTWILLCATFVVAGFIYLVERRLPGSREGAQAPILFPNVNPEEVTELRLAYASGEVLQAEKINHQWTLRFPTYPAQQTAVENFVSNIVAIRTLDRIASHEVALQSAKAFGLDPPRARVDVQAGTNRLSFQIGARAPLTNNVYLRLQPSGEVVLAGGTVASLVPASPVAWRDTALVNFPAISFDQMRIRAGARSFELARNATKKNWQIVRPVPARADQARVTGLIEILRGAQVVQYVTERPSDLERFGLQNPDVELAFLSGTNRLYSVEFGRAVTNQPALVYARLLGNSNVVAVSREVADFLRQPAKYFQESQLVDFRPANLDRVAVESVAKFVLQRTPSGQWSSEIQGEKVSIDPQLANRFFTNVLSLEILDIAKEVPTEADLRAFGLLPPKATYSFFERLTNAGGMLTNILFTEISFGVVQEDKIFTRRSDETPVYVAEYAKMFALAREPYELRDRSIWKLSPGAITGVSFSNAAGTNSLQRAANGTWSDDAITQEAINESVHRLATLAAVEWTAKGERRKTAFGFGEFPLTLTLEVQETNGLSQAVAQFGNATMKGHVYAATVLPGENEPVIFEFPGPIFHSLVQLLPVPK